MTPTFVDTSFLLALLLSDDELHGRAVAWQRAANGPLLTTEYVLVELADALVAQHLRSSAMHAISALRNDPAAWVEPASTALLDRGLALFAERQDKRWSLTDCVSFVVMHDAGVRDALTADHHFEQAGFRALLRQEPPT